MSAPTMDPIELQISGSAHKSWPCTRGVPLAQGSVQSLENLAVVNADGDRLPTQLRQLSRWPDGSIKWVLADFQSQGDTTCRLVSNMIADGPGATQAPSSAAVQISLETDCLRVDTGALRFTMPLDRVGFFENLHVGATRLTGDQGARLWARIREGGSRGGTQRRIYGMGGECRADLAPDAWSVEVEETGPLRSVITCRGALELFAPMHHYGGYRPLQFVLRIHVYAGKAFVRLQHTVVFSLNPRETEVEELGLELPLAAADGGFTCCAESAENGIACKPGATVVLAQQLDNQCRLRTTLGDQTRVVETERTRGWLTRQHAGGGVGVAMRHMAEEYPKALRVSPGRDGIEALPWHDPDGGCLSLARYDEDVAWHEGEGVYADGMGTARTTEMFATWFEAGTAAAAIDDLECLLHPPHVAVAPTHMAACEVTGGFAPATEHFPRSEHMLTGFVDWLDRQIRIGRWYGFFDHGDALVAWEEASNDWRFSGRWGWCNSEWDPRHGVWIQYLRTGNPALFDLGEAMTRHSVDVDVCHWHPLRPYFVGGGYRHSVDHFGDEPCASHTFIDNWIDHYYLTGDLRTLEVLREAGEFLRRYRWTEDAQYSFSLRSIGNTLRGLLYVWEVTGDDSLLQRATEVYEVIARGQNDDGSWNKRFQVSTANRQPEQLPYGMASEGTTLAVELGTEPFTVEEHLALWPDKPITHVLPAAEQKGYQTHYLLIGIELFHRITGRQDVADAYVKAVDWFCGAPGPLGAHFALQQHYGGILCRHLARAWRLTGQTTYLEIGRQVLARLLATQDWSDDPRRRGSVGMSPMYVSLLFFGVPALLGALAEADVDEPEV